MIYKLLKKWHYISCFTDDEKIMIKKTAKLMLQWIYLLKSCLETNQSAYMIKMFNL